MNRKCVLALCMMATFSLAATPAYANLWDWMQEWSGPGPFDGRHPMLMFNLCPKGVLTLSAEEAPACLFVDLRNLKVEDNDNFPVPVSVTMIDVGVTHKATIRRLRNSLELGYGIGWLHASSDEQNGIGGGTMNKLTFTAPRAVLKPLLALRELGSAQPVSPRDPLTRLLSVPKMHIGATLVAGTMDASQLGVPASVNGYSNGWEWVLSRGIMLDFGELLPERLRPERLLGW